MESKKKELDLEQEVLSLREGLEYYKSQCRYSSLMNGVKGDTCIDELSRIKLRIGQLEDSVNNFIDLVRKVTVAGITIIAFILALMF